MPRHLREHGGESPLRVVYTRQGVGEMRDVVLTTQRHRAACDILELRGLRAKRHELLGGVAAVLGVEITLIPEHAPQLPHPLDRVRKQPALASYYLLYAVLGEFEAQLNRFEQAGEHFRRALELTDLPSEQTLLEKRLRECDPNVMGHRERVTATRS